MARAPRAARAASIASAHRGSARGRIRFRRVWRDTPTAPEPSATSRSSSDAASAARRTSADSRDVAIRRAPERVDPALRERRGEGRAHRPGGRAGPASEVLLVDAVLARFLDPEHEAVGERAALQLVEHPAPPLLVASGKGRRTGIQNDSAPDRRDRREPAEHEAVPGRGRDRSREPELDARRAPGRNLAGLQNPHRGGGFRSEVVERQPVPAPDARRARQKLDAGDDAAGVANADGVASTSPRRRSESSAPTRFALTLSPARASSTSRPCTSRRRTRTGRRSGRSFEPVVLADAAGDEAPGHDGSEARDRGTRGRSGSRAIASPRGDSSSSGARRDARADEGRLQSSRDPRPSSPRRARSARSRGRSRSRARARPRW